MARCPGCGKEHVKPAEEVLAVSASLYAPCGLCAADAPLDKLLPFSDLGYAPGRDSGRCPRCGKRHLDIVMAQALGILVGQGLRPARAPLKDVGTPLIVYGVGLAEPPRLGPDSLLLLLDAVDRPAAGRILAEVPEVRGVIRRTGSPGKSVGLPGLNEKPHVYELLAGCDLRADVVSCLLGALVFYRNQAQMHVEFWRDNSVKIKVLEQMFLDGELEGRTIVDGLSSAGTLGLLAAAAGARKVVLNDAWLPAVQDMLLNIEANASTLGVKLERLADPAALPQISREPTLVARASGNVAIEVYHADLVALAAVIRSCDICIVDPFPGVGPEPFVRAWRGITRDKIVTL